MLISLADVKLTVDFVSTRTSSTGVLWSTSGPPSPVIFPVVAASSLTCGSCCWFGPVGCSDSGRGFSSAVIFLLC